MAITEADQTEAGEAVEDSAAKKRLSKKTLIVAAGAVLLIGAATGGAWQFGLLGAEPVEEAPQAVAAAPKLYYTLPDFTVNLSGTADRVQYLRMKIALEADDEATLKAIEPRLPRIIDIFQTYLRELRPSDLEGSAGLYRLREELVRRVNLTIAPQEVDDVLFQEVLVQ